MFPVAKPTIKNTTTIATKSITTCQVGTCASSGKPNTIRMKSFRIVIR